MKSIDLHKIAWIVVGCIFAEAAYMAMQIGGAAFSHAYTLSEFLDPNNALYSVPTHFIIVGIVFLIAIIYAEYKHIYSFSYYIIAAVVTALIYYAYFWVSGLPINLQHFFYNLLCAIVAGAVYWVIVPRRIL